MPTLEDKIVQKATAQVLGAIYEEDFLGFTHICSKNRRGCFIVLRHTIRARRWARLKAIHEKLRERTHVPIPVVGRWLRSVWLG